MKGTTLSRVTRRPVTSPHKAPAATPAAAAAPGPAAFRSAMAMTTVLEETIEPTDRSMPAATITSVIPSAAVQTIAAWRAISSRFAGPRNCGPTRTRNTAHTSSRPSAGPPRASSSRAFMRPRPPHP